MHEAKLSISSDYIQEATFDKQGGYAKSMALLRMLPRPTAFFAGNDMIALGVLLAIRELGLRCPEDISLLGFDNLDFAETTSPSLSSVHQSGYQLGATAARIVLDRVSGDTSPAKHCVLQTELKIRESVAALAGDTKRKAASGSKRKSIQKRSKE
jgi:LacI family transcriptional regulator